MMFDLVDMTPLERERLVCSISAAVEYRVPVDIMLAIAEIENGRPYLVSSNANGSIDIGVMQINSAYLRDLRKFGITYEDVEGEGCYPYRLAAWRVKRHVLDDQGDIWAKAANYHSRTPEFNQVYRAKLKTIARKWAAWLQSIFNVKPFAEE